MSFFDSKLFTKIEQEGKLPEIETVVSFETGTLINFYAGMLIVAVTIILLIAIVKRK